MHPVKNFAWYAGNKLLSAPFYLVGLGAAKELHDGAVSSLKGAYELPLNSLQALVTNQGLWSFAKGAGKTVFGIGQSLIDIPLETLVMLAATVATAKAVTHCSERKRQYLRDEQSFKEKYGIK